jgi:hypothetical protein
MSREQVVIQRSRRAQPSAYILALAVGAFQLLSAGCNGEGTPDKPGTTAGSGGGGGTSGAAGAGGVGDGGGGAGGAAGAGGGGDGGGGMGGAPGAGGGGAGGGTRLTPIVWARSAAHNVQFALVSALDVDPTGDVLLTGAVGFEGGDWGNGVPSPHGSVDVLLAKLAPTDGSAVWSRRFGSDGNIISSDVAADPSGNVVLATTFVGTGDFGGAPIIATGMENEIVVAKYDGSGAHLWSKGFGPGLVPMVKTDPAGNVVILTRCSGTNDFGGGPISGGPLDMCVAKLDASGGHLWSKRFTGEGDRQALSLAVDTTGDVIFCGYLYSPMDFGGGPIGAVGLGQQGFLVKLSADGSHAWSKALGGSDTTFYAVAVDPKDVIVVAGSHFGTGDFGGGAITTDDQDAFVASYDDSGAYVYAHTFGTNLREIAFDVAIEANGNALVAGVVQSLDQPFDGGDVLMMELSPNGTQVSARVAGGADVQSAEAVAASPSGGAYVGGRFYGPLELGAKVLNTPGHDAFVARVR